MTLGDVTPMKDVESYLDSAFCSSVMAPGTTQREYFGVSMSWHENQGILRLISRFDINAQNNARVPGPQLAK